METGGAAVLRASSAERTRPAGHGLPGVRVVNSDIRNAEIIHGTQQKVLDTFDYNAPHYSPDFVLLAYAPSSSMIGSDLDTAAESIGGRSGLPTASVNLHGDKDYLYGVSYTLEAMGKLLLTKQDTVPNTVNLLGCNTLDWANETLSAVEEMLTNAGYTVLSRWGMKDTTENLKKASAASVNLVVTAAGFRLARYMEAEYGIPYVVGAPFGADRWAALLDELRGAPACGERPGCEAPEVLVIGEQLTADAIRQALLRRGYGNIQVLSFYDMEKSVMLTGDQKLSSEDDLVKKLQQPSIKLVIGDPDCKAAASRDIPWDRLAQRGQYVPGQLDPQFQYGRRGAGPLAGRRFARIGARYETDCNLRKRRHWKIHHHTEPGCRPGRAGKEADDRGLRPQGRLHPADPRRPGPPRRCWTPCGTRTRRM